MVVEEGTLNITQFHPLHRQGHLLVCDEKGPSKGVTEKTLPVLRHVLLLLGFEEKILNYL